MRSFAFLLLAMAACQQQPGPLKRISLPKAGTADSLPLVDYDPGAFPFQPAQKATSKDLFLYSAGRPVIKASQQGVQAFCFRSGMAIDADGSPRAYHPTESKGLDDLSNAGRPGNWWALATDNGMPSGNPVVQGPGDPAPGFYVSTTSLADPYRAAHDPAKYVDASTIPYVVLPASLRISLHAALGDLVVVYNLRNKKMCGAIFADTGPEGKLGEGSIALAEALGIPSSPRTGGVADELLYVVFPGSGNGLPLDRAALRSQTQALWEQWGGNASLQKCQEAIDQLRSPQPVVIMPL